MTVCAAAIVEAAMTINASNDAVRLKPDTTTVRLNPDTALGEQITRTLPFCTDSMNHKGGDVAGPAEGV